MKFLYILFYVISALCLVGAVLVRTGTLLPRSDGYLLMAGALFAFTLGRVIHQNNRR